MSENREASVSTVSDQTIERHRFIFEQKEDDGSSIPAGLTYLGQLVAHDIVPETQVSSNQREVQPYLNLTSIYGTDDNDQPVDDNLFIGDFFRIDVSDRVEQPRESPHVSQVHLVRDLPRDDKGVPDIPDKRDDENTIVSQLHLLWMRFHNALQRASKGDKRDTREEVVKVFQSVVVSDLLRIILNDKVFDFYFRDGNNIDLGNTPADKWSIPKEFSLAAFRYGHSMVLSRYGGFGLNGDGKDLEELFRPNEKLDRDMEINWSAFFPAEFFLAPPIDTPVLADMIGQPIDLPPQSANKIDQRITCAMLKIPTPFRGIVDIIGANLKASLRKGMPTGIDCWNTVHKRLSGTALDGMLNDGNRLNTSHLDAANLRLETANADNMRHGTPTNYKPLEIEEISLWAYLLMEARFFALGAELGPLGSILVGETISAAIKNSDVSIWDKDSSEFKLRAANTDHVGLESVSFQAFDAERIRSNHPHRYIKPIIRDVLQAI